MPRRAFLIVAAGLLLAADAADREPLQGSWKVVGMEHGGKRVPNDQFADLHTLIRGNVLASRPDGSGAPSGQRRMVAHGTIACPSPTGQPGAPTSSTSAPRRATTDRSRAEWPMSPMRTTFVASL